MAQSKAKLLVPPGTAVLLAWASEQLPKLVAAVCPFGTRTLVTLPVSPAAVARQRERRIIRQIQALGYRIEPPLNPQGKLFDPGGR